MMTLGFEAALACVASCEFIAAFVVSTQHAAQTRSTTLCFGMKVLNLCICGLDFVRIFDYESAVIVACLSFINNH